MNFKQNPIRKEFSPTEEEILETIKDEIYKLNERIVELENNKVYQKWLKSY